MYHEGMCRESMYCARTKSFSWRPDNESLCFEHDAPYAGISLREQLFITNIVLMPLQNRRGCCPSANHPTRFCQAPNRFDKDAVKDIMFGRDDTKKDSNGVTVIPYSKLDERAPVELAAYCILETAYSCSS